MAEPSSSEMSETIDRMSQEIERLQRKLGDLHATDVNALRRAYRSLAQHVDALEHESAGMVEQMQEFETAVLPPELVARELGVAAAVAAGVSVLAQTAKVLPGLRSPGLVAKGLWLVGGAVVLFRLSAGALAHWAVMLDRNARRKRRLLRKLETIQERVAIMSALQQRLELPPSSSELDLAKTAAAAAVTGGGEHEGDAKRTRGSPITSASSGELVEYPEPAGAAEGGRSGGGKGPQRPHSPTRRPSSAVAATRGRSGSGSGSSGEEGVVKLDMTALHALGVYARLGERSSSGKS